MALPSSSDHEELLSKVGERSLLVARWLLAFVYLGLILVLGFIVFKFFQETLQILLAWGDLNKTQLILRSLALMDMALLAGLLVMVMVSGYDNFVADLDSDETINWMSRVDSDSIKLKIAATIVAISSVRLLQVYMEIGDTPEDDLLWYTLIHSVFVLSALGLALFNRVKR